MTETIQEAAVKDLEEINIKALDTSLANALAE